MTTTATTAHTESETSATPGQEMIIVAADTKRVHCPPNNYPLWSQHPRVYIDLSKVDEAECPYCGNRFVKSK